MALRHFEHLAASSVDQAVKLAAAHPDRTAYVAGGTDLLGALKDGVRPAYPALLIDLKPIDSLRGIREDRGELRIGTLTTLDALARNTVVLERYPLLAQAARAVASPQIRNMATIGGNLCQEPRCWYYRTPENLFECLRKGGERCNAVLGENRHHSIFGAMRASDPGCTVNCPAHVAIPVYLEHIRRGRIDEAARLQLESNPMPAITGRVCPHFCEQGCNRTQLDEPVSTRSVERFLGDRILDNAAAFYRVPRKATKKRIAVVGAGPAGLAAAHDLRLAGHEVTVFDDHPEAGGMLRWCIPAYRLPADVLKRQIQAFEGMGVHFSLGVAVGRRGLSLQSLRRDFHAVFLATGTWRDRKLGIENEVLLTQGLPFLVDIRRGRQPSVGKKVLVIGGGSVAVDVAVSARRLGAAKVTMACLEARDQMPAFPEDLELALQEGIRLLPSWGPHRILDRNGALSGMELVRCTSVFDSEGRFKPGFDPATVTAVEADQVLVAIGQAADPSYAGSSLKTGRGLLAADEQTQATSLQGVYAGGDAVSGVGTVIQAIAAGRRAAAAIDRALATGSGRRRPVRRTEMPSSVEINTDALTRSARVVPASRAPSERGIGCEDCATLDLHVVQTEAGRCINCGCVAVNASDLGPALLALDARIRTTRRTIPAEEFFAARLLKTTVLEDGEVLTEVVIPSPPAGSLQRYLKFRVRNAIDFPIVGVACVLSQEGGAVTRARLALGAVAPVPLRAREVEAFLCGRRIDEQTAEAAGAMAVRRVMPLPLNRHKVQILRTLVKRAILGAGS
jgi:NADPH-dependent glutamate synthase beta subunit-like oxidoreductase/CO/xanthine dehydrogenase FAD-binding subunit